MMGRGRSAGLTLALTSPIQLPRLKLPTFPVA